MTAIRILAQRYLRFIRGETGRDYVIPSIVTAAIALPSIGFACAHSLFIDKYLSFIGLVE